MEGGSVLRRNYVEGLLLGLLCRVIKKVVVEYGCYQVAADARIEQ